MRFQTKQQVDYWVGGLLLLILFLPVRALGKLLRRDHATTHRRGCVVIKMVGAGSLFLAMPSMQAIRKEFPPGRFYLVGTRDVTRFAEANDWFDACWTIDDSSFRQLLTSSIRVLWRIARNADHLIDLEVHSRLTTVFGLLSMVRNRIGFVDEIVFWRRGFYTHMTYFNTHGPVYAFYDMLANWFGIERIEVSAFHAAYRQRVVAETLPADIAQLPRYIAIGHACSGFGEERQLLPDEWRRLLRPLQVAGFEFVLLGGAADADAADAIIAAVGAGRNLCGRLSIAQSAKVIARASGFHGIDSLLLHLSRALGVSTVSVWGPTNPATRLRPISAPERVAFVGMPCSPCIHVNETPPCQGRRDCMGAAVASVVAPVEPQSAGTEPAMTVGWDVDPQASRVRAVSIQYA